MDSALVTLLVDSFPKILIPGLAVTLPLAIASFACAFVIAVVTALVQYANVPIAKQIARLYIWIVRGTPLFVQLYLVYFGLPDLGIEPTKRPKSMRPVSSRSAMSSALPLCRLKRMSG